MAVVVELPVFIAGPLSPGPILWFLHDMARAPFIDLGRIVLRQVLSQCESHLTATRAADFR
jgi:hypothetical protein